MSAIEWQTALGYAEDSAISSRKPILFDYFDPECIGCQQMDEVTFAAAEVVAFVHEHLIPLRIDIEKKSSYDEYTTIWSPTLLVLDFQGHEIQRTVGFLLPDDFMAQMHLGIAKVLYSAGEHPAAGVHLKRLISRFPDNCVVPEAIYFTGVNLYRQNDDPLRLKAAYERLLDDYPDSCWTRRASPYRFL